MNQYKAPCPHPIAAGPAPPRSRRSAAPAGPSRPNPHFLTASNPHMIGKGPEAPAPYETACNSAWAVLNWT